MTPEKFRQLALSFPETVEVGQRGRPDYRVDDHSFATLFAEEDWGVIKMTSELQTELVENDPEIFKPCNGAWGKNGATVFVLSQADEGLILKALASAWRKHAPETLVEKSDG